LKPLNGLKELGLTGFIDIANNQEANMMGIKLDDDHEWLGINTPNQLRLADERKNKTNKL